RRNSSSFRHGAPSRANGMEPESYQASMTSGTRCAGPPHSGQLITTASTYGRCGSRPDRSRPPRSPTPPPAPPQARWPSPPPHRGCGCPHSPVRRPPPVPVVAQPLPVPAVLDRRRLPVGPLVLGQQPVLDLGSADEPGRQRVVEQRRVAPPAMRVAVLVRLA